ncbi:polysaccharide biosynthesis protein GtrA [Clostridium botulinum]|nr:polysaccharide biosynthesis protein GtrA [Clostridium botulinum]
MNVYDFDKTIYDGDSTLDFYLFSLKKTPSIIIYLPNQIYVFLKYIFGRCTKLEFKEKFYSFLKGIPNVDKLVIMFWENKNSKIKPWYLQRKKESDVIISASPEFLLEPICKKLKISHLIASKVNKNTGICEGENCYGEEKVIRLKEYFINPEIKEFYSDSLSDAPLSLLSKTRYIVNGSKIVEWDKYEYEKAKKIKQMFFSRQFLNFLIVGVINTTNGIIFSFLYSIYIDVNISFILGYITAMTISYILNSSIVFKENKNILKYIKFCISYIPNFIIQNIFVMIFYNIMQWNKLIVFILSSMICVPVTFVIMKFFAFGKKTKSIIEN